ncbi:MAG: universal stress protein [Desulfobulbaceae bacterium]|nr:universal stress protein [Desulfobulbaceae bacterium]
MGKQFLVTISSSVDHLFGVKFICSFFNKMSDDRVTLFHICRRDSNDMNKILLAQWDDSASNIQGHLSVGTRRSINKAKGILGESKMSIDQIITKTVDERYGKVKDILGESSRGFYDAIILGRRASYSLQWMFERSADETVQAMIKDSSCSSPLWICPESEPGRKNVLVCVDGSENAYRAVDHVGYILSTQHQHTITIFHVENGNGEESEGMFQRAEAILQEHNIGTDRISRNSIRGISASRSILGEIKNGGYSAVALGMRGQTRGLLRDLNLAGGTTLKLISKIDKTALWCCP